MVDRILLPAPGGLSSMPDSSPYSRTGIPQELKSIQWGSLRSYAIGSSDLPHSDLHSTQATLRVAVESSLILSSVQICGCHPEDCGDQGLLEALVVSNDPMLGFPAAYPTPRASHLCTLSHLIATAEDTREPCGLIQSSHK